ncbi:MAG: cold shock domain-containing protein [Alphaproteobacteria bacterium]|nr:cold shock domain-containing protein [Alphaproteobacteria bacterium]
MREGTVKWYNGKKCYGFVSPKTANEGGDTSDVFVHSTSLRDAGIRFLNEGDVIKFDEEMRGGKLSATKIELVSRDEESAKKFQERRASFGGDRGDRGGYNRDRGDRGPRRDRDGDDKKSGWGFWKK